MSDKRCPKCGKERCEVMDAYHENDEAEREHVCHGHAGAEAVPGWEEAFGRRFTHVFPNLWQKKQEGKGELPMFPEDIKSFIRKCVKAERERCRLIVSEALGLNAHGFRKRPSQATRQVDSVLTDVLNEIIMQS